MAEDEDLHEDGRRPDARVTYNADSKFDLQLSAALVRERALGDIFEHAIFDGSGPVRLELKTETYQWERTGNICIEHHRNGKPSGIHPEICKADIWVHELRRDGATLCWLMFPIERLRVLARAAYANGRRCDKGGDGALSQTVHIALRNILK